jgi:DNA primase large subunit
MLTVFVKCELNYTGQDSPSSTFVWHPKWTLILTSVKYCSTYMIRHFQFQADFLSRSCEYPLFSCQQMIEGPSGTVYQNCHLSKTFCNALVWKQLPHQHILWGNFRLNIEAERYETQANTFTYLLQGSSCLDHPLRWTHRLYRNVSN